MPCSLMCTGASLPVTHAAADRSPPPAWVPARSRALPVPCAVRGCCWPTAHGRPTRLLTAVDDPEFTLHRPQVRHDTRAHAEPDERRRTPSPDAGAPRRRARDTFYVTCLLAQALPSHATLRGS